MLSIAIYVRVYSLCVPSMSQHSTFGPTQIKFRLVIFPSLVLALPEKSCRGQPSREWTQDIEDTLSVDGAGELEASLEFFGMAMMRATFHEGPAVRRVESCLSCY